MEGAKMGADAANCVEITYFAAECMEFLRYGEYVEELPTVKAALEYYDKIPPERLNAGKGIGIHVHDPDDAEYIQEYPLLTGRTLDIDILQMMYGVEKYPQVMEAARELADLRPDIRVVDSKGLLKKAEVTMDAGELAKKFNALQRKLDPDSYDYFYPDADVQEKKIAMQLLTENGKQDYLDWLNSGNLEQFPEVEPEVRELRGLLGNINIQWPETLPPFIYVRFSESTGLEDRDVLRIEEANTLFGSLDQARAADNKEKGEGGYDKTAFIIYYQMDGKMSTYEGRQDFGDGEGTLLDHIDAFQRYYLETEEGERMLAEMKKDDARSMKESCEYIRDEFLPYLKYYCNLYEMERALKEEQVINQKVPMVTDRQEARREYQRDVQCFIEESRRALSRGGELPQMPDIKDYEETKEKKSYREQVMQEIEEEAKQYGMTVEEYAKNGYEPKENIGRGAGKRR